MLNINPVEHFVTGQASLEARRTLNSLRARYDEVSAKFATAPESIKKAVTPALNALATELETLETKAKGKPSKWNEAIDDLNALIKDFETKIPAELRSEA